MRFDEPAVINEITYRDKRMSIIKFDIGSTIYCQGLEYVIKGYAAFDEVLLKRNVEPFNEKIVKLNELIKEPKNIQVQPTSLSEANDEQFKKALERYNIIEPLLIQQHKSVKDVTKIAKKSGKGLATIYRWLRTFEKYGTVSALIPNFGQRGAKGKSRLDISVNTVIDNVIEDLYLNKQQFPMTTIYSSIVEKCMNLGIQPPVKNTVRNRINALHPKLIAKYRKGIRVNETRGMPKKYPEVKMPLDVIQIDHTKMDVIIVDASTRQAIGRPYITVAIDVYSRMIFGFYISLEAPSFFSVGQCLLNGILPKDDFIKKLNVQGEWAIFGLPKVIFMDNAKEFRSVSLHNFCQEFRIIDEYRPVARPEFGGHIERVIGTCMKKVHQLPGTTYSNIAQKRNYDSQKEAAMTIDELEQWYLDFLINIYHKTEHSALGMTPEEKFYQVLYGVGDKTIPFIPNLPADTLKLRMALLPEIKRSVQKNGITIDYITYFSEALRKWIVPTQYKKLVPESINMVSCRRDPRDISKIYVYDEDIKDFIVVPYADIKRPAMNLSELRDAISEAKKQITGRELEPHNIFEAYGRLRQYVSDAKTQTKSVRRKQSSKNHMNKTLKMEKDIIDYAPKTATINTQILQNNSDDDDDDGFEYYPVG